MSIKRIFIISTYPLFGHGLRSLLHQNSQLDIVGQEKDIDRAIERIREIEPDIVILDGDEPPYDSMLTVLRLLKENTNTRVIGLNLGNNTLYTYEARQWIAKNVEDLLEAIDTSSQGMDDAQ